MHSGLGPPGILLKPFTLLHLSGSEKGGHDEKRSFAGGISRISLNSLESLDNGLVLLCFLSSGGSLESLHSLDSLESI